MRQVVIENPILNSAFAEPARHFRFDDDGITSDVIDKRRPSSYFVPIPRARKRSNTQLALAEDWVESRIEENQDVNRIRERVDIWRRGGYPGVTAITAALLASWTEPERERKLFFCQIEALETVIYLAEVAPRFGDAWIDNHLRDAAASNNPDLYRMALKMATGSGKTVVMAMLIAWQVLNKLANPRDRRFTDQILIVTPGLTIRDRLRVLLPNDPDNYYRARDIVTPEQLVQIGSARIIITILALKAVP